LATKKEMIGKALEGFYGSTKLFKEFCQQLEAFNETRWNNQIEVSCTAVRAIASKFKYIRDAFKQRMTTELEELEATLHCGFEDSTDFLTHLKEHGKQLPELDETTRNNRIEQYCEEVQDFLGKFNCIGRLLKQMND